jgi:hypothetical protein
MVEFVTVAVDLDNAGLMWQPEVGDEITRRDDPGATSILFDPQGLTHRQLRQIYLWLPSLDQLVLQFEARQVILSHAGLEVTESGMCYKTVLQVNYQRIAQSTIEATGETLRTAMGVALQKILVGQREVEVH